MAHDRAAGIRLATQLTLVAALARPVVAAPPAVVVAHGPRDVPAVALTFDLCPTRAPVALDERIVDRLLDAGAHATFFVSGRWAEARPEAVLRLAAEPRFELANHSYRHPHLRTLDDAHVRSELAVTQDVVRRLGGRVPRWFRAPYGEVDERIAAAAADVGLGTIQFDVASGDPAPGVTPERLARSVLDRVRPGSIVVLHANHPAFPTADALPAILDGLRRRGLAAVTVSELLDRAPPVERRE